MTKITIAKVFQSNLLCLITGPDLKQNYNWTIKFFFCLLPQQHIFSFPLIIFAFAFDYLLTLFKLDTLIIFAFLNNA